MGEAGFAKMLKSMDHLKTDAKGEMAIREALELHPLRTLNPDEAGYVCYSYVHLQVACL